jgi:hypothetical protein
MRPTRPSAIGRSNAEASFAKVGRGEMNGHALTMRKLEAAIAQCGLDAFAAFLESDAIHQR